MVILDWYLDIERDVEQQLEPDADADNDEPRGEFTLKITTTNLQVMPGLIN